MRPSFKVLIAIVLTLAAAGALGAAWVSLVEAPAPKVATSGTAAIGGPFTLVSTNDGNVPGQMAPLLRLYLLSRRLPDCAQQHQRRPREARRGCGQVATAVRDGGPSTRHPRGVGRIPQVLRFTNHRADRTPGSDRPRGQGIPRIRRLAEIRDAGRRQLSRLP